MQVQVTEDHIKQGRKAKCNYCPVALALNEKLHTRVGVGQSNFWLVDTLKEEVPVVRHLPSIVTNFVKDFDRGLEVKPFTFEIDI